MWAYAGILPNNRLDPALVIFRADPPKPMDLKLTNTNLMYPDKISVSMRELEFPLKFQSIFIILNICIIPISEMVLRTEKSGKKRLRKKHLYFLNVSL